MRLPHAGMDARKTSQLTEVEFVPGVGSGWNAGVAPKVVRGARLSGPSGVKGQFGPLADAASCRAVACVHA